MSGSATKKLVRKLGELRGMQVVPSARFFIAERERPLEEGEVIRATRGAELNLGYLGARLTCERPPAAI